MVCSFWSAFVYIIVLLYVLIAISFIAFFAVLDSRANPIPSELFSLKLLIPITFPFSFISGPPELPRFSSAFVWM